MELSFLSKRQQLCWISNIYGGKLKKRTTASPFVCSCCGRLVYPDTMTNDCYLYSSITFFYPSNAGQILVCSDCDSHMHGVSDALERVKETNLATLSTLGGNVRQIRQYYLFFIELEKE